METLGERLKRLRGERGMSAAQLGRAAQIGENAVFKIEAGITKQPSFDTGIRLSHALGIKPEELAFGSTVVAIGRSEETEPSSPGSEERLERVEAAVAEIPELVALVGRLNGRVAELLAEREERAAAPRQRTSPRARKTADQGAAG